MASGKLPLWFPASELFKKTNLLLPTAHGFENAATFRRFMAELVDKEIIQEKTGRTLAEPDLSKLKFTLSPWFFVLMKSLIERDGK
jgi:hypothetical protein